jgi:uroporphyrin-III C-methyltransferase
MTVALVGAGPGDPGLITVRGLQLVRACEALVYDRLVAPELVEEAPADALRIPRDAHEQEEIDRLLVTLGRRGLRVVRLKGGDPYLFGRGGEEAIALREAGVEFEVVPGVSALAAVPAAAGIPVTHRLVSQSVTAVTGHPGKGSAEPDYAALARTPGTLVVFMGLGRLARLAAALIEHGKPADTPAAAIASGTTRDEHVVFAPLAEIAEAAAELEPPALVVVGDVVRLAERIGGMTVGAAAVGAP